MFVSRFVSADKHICQKTDLIAKSILVAILMIPLLYLGDDSGYFVSQAKIALKNQCKTIKQ